MPRLIPVWLSVVSVSAFVVGFSSSGSFAETAQFPAQVSVGVLR